MATDRKLGALLILAVVAATALSCSDRPALAPFERSAPQQTVVAPLLEKNDHAKPVPGQFIVVFKNNVERPEQKTANLVRDIPGVDPKRVWGTALKGFLAVFSDEAVDRIRRDPDVAYVQQDQEAGPGSTTQYNAPWHLDRIDQDDLPLDSTYTYDFDGTGVNLYVIDSGVRTSHNEFGSRAQAVYQTGSWVPANVDCTGHGTGVAAVAAGATYGVAKGANIKSIRIDDCDSSTPDSEVIEAMDWLAANRVTPAVATFSWHHSSQGVADAIEGVIDAGVTFVVLAGNYNQDACSAVTQLSQIITVGAIDSSDTRASFSEYGPCVDLWAPGVNITTADIASDNDTQTSSGTSFSTPMVAGVAALYLDQHNDPVYKVVHSTVGSASDTPVYDKKTGSPSMILYSQLPRVFVEPVGPEQVHPDDYCWWTAEARGGRLPYTFTWSGVLSGTGVTKSGSIVPPGGTLSVTAQDLSSHADTGYIVIASSTEYSRVCPD